MSIRPLQDRVIVEPLALTDKSAGGIIIPDTAKEKPSEGKVVAVGSGYRGKDGKITPLYVKKGDRVLYGKWSGNEVKIEGKDLVIVRESDILAVVGGDVVIHAKTKAPAKAAATPSHHHVPGSDCC